MIWASVLLGGGPEVGTNFSLSDKPERVGAEIMLEQQTSPREWRRGRCEGITEPLARRVLNETVNCASYLSQLGNNVI